jgi:Xaa-Pro aminopeptidase
MYLSDEEKDRRFGELKKKMKENNIDVLLVSGMDTRGGGTGTGSFRYLTDFFIIFHYAVLVFPMDRDPVIFISSELQKYWAMKHGWIKDVRATSNISNAVASLLYENGYGIKRTGISGSENHPAALTQKLKEVMSEAMFIDCSDMLFEMRLVKNIEEQRLMKTCAEILDSSFVQICQEIKPGMREYEIVGRLEGFHRSHGVDDTFNLISSGPFPHDGGEPFPGLPWYPSKREIRENDVILLEMTGSYGGYWTQLVRTIWVGEPNEVFKSYHRVALKSIESGIKVLKKGNTPSDLVEAMEESAKDESDFSAGPPFGHFTGLDLVEARVSRDTSIKFKPGITVIIHPTIQKRMGPKAIFWGQTYLVGEEGCLRLNEVGDDLVVI